ncbi:efflux RND transporter periplasmic adaptor subunit [Flagellimonas marinaquae]|nr:efflux RND transporter periplasmic adaptor subunit [Allomuricauda aquimarina]
MLMLLVALGCGNTVENPKELKTGEETGNEIQPKEGIVLSQVQVNALQIDIDTLQKRNMGSFVEANGQLEVPPQNEATITSVIGANIASIEVIEGDEVKKGQVLAYLAHPDMITKQTDYLNAYTNGQFLGKEFDRQKKLYEAGVGSGSAFQKIEAEYEAAKSLVKGYEAQLQQLNIDVSSVRSGKIQQRIALRSPIEGAVQKVKIKTGQYVGPQTELMEVVNTHHVHADMMVFEKDVHKVSKGQKVSFKVQSLADTELSATIYSVGKTFEESPKALHVHAEIENKAGNLIPGMYIQGRILTDSFQTMAFPQGAIAEANGKSFVFLAQKQENDWYFEPVEVITGVQDNDWVEIKFLESPDGGSQYALNNAYYLMAERQKGEAEHSH